MTKSNFFFWGIVSDVEAEEMWKVLHDHFKKLESRTSQDDEAVETFSGKAVAKK